MLNEYPEIKNIWQGIVSLPGLEMRQLPQTQMEPPNSTNLKASILEINFLHILYRDFGKFCSKSDQKPFYGIIQAYVDAVAFWKHLNEDQIETWIIQKQAFI